MAFLFNASGNPEPSPEIQRRLRAIDPRLSLRFHPDFSRHWSVRCEWKSDDRRWERVQGGDINPADAYDVIGWLPIDCSVEDAPAYLERTLAQFSQRTAERVAFDIEKWNTGSMMSDHINNVMSEMTNDRFGFDDGKVKGNRTAHVIPK